MAEALDFEAMALAIRGDCCHTWTKPCSYHEGWFDGLDIGRQVLVTRVTELEPVPVWCHDCTEVHAFTPAELVELVIVLQAIHVEAIDNPEPYRYPESVFDVMERADCLRAVLSDHRDPEMLHEHIESFMTGGGWEQNDDGEWVLAVLDQGDPNDG